MKLHENQLNLIRHIIWFNIMAYEDCLKFLDTENTGDMTAMSYVFRPLTKNGYLGKNEKGVVTVLKKGRDLFPDEGPLISTTTKGKARDRVLQVSKVAMWMEKIGVPISGELLDTEEPYYIPSTCWRDIGKGILSTTRFAGMLLAYGKKYAVYDIGDGTMEWQIKAEAALFFYRYGSFETKADGMILICDDGKRNEIARQIIRHTMWNRKTLLKDRYAETDKPVRYSNSPIKLRTQYEHVYLTTPKLLSESLDMIYDEDYYIENGVEGGTLRKEPKNIVTLMIPEPLPARKELTSSLEDHWIRKIHEEIAKENQTGIPYFEKAFVLIRIYAPRGTNNARVWDTSNRAINVIINNLKGIFFDDDNFEHMACGIVADWGENGRTEVRICDFEELKKCEIFR